MRTLCVTCLSILAALLVGCGKDSQPEESRRAEKVLWAGAGDNKQSFIKFVKEEGLPGIKGLLKSDSSQDRMFAITCLGLLKDNAEATELLLKSANGEDSEDAYWAIIALGAKGAPEAKDLIEKFLKSDDPRRREGACEAIGQYADTSLYPLLAAAARDDDPRVRRAATRTLQTIREGKVVP